MAAPRAGLSVPGTGETYTSWATRRGAAPPGAAPALLYPDLFHDHFYPATLRAAHRVLERLGYRVLLPPEPPPSIRTLLRGGLVGPAERQARRTFARLGPWLDEGVPVVAVDPGTVAVFRDDPAGLLPADRRTRRARRCFRGFAAFLAERGLDRLPRVRGRALLAVPDAGRDGEREATRSVLRRLGLGVETLGGDPAAAVRRAGAGALVVGSGFGPRKALERATGHEILHLADVVDLAFDRTAGTADARNGACRSEGELSRASVGLTVAALLLAGGVLRAWRR